MNALGFWIMLGGVSYMLLSSEAHHFIGGAIMLAGGYMGWVWDVPMPESDDEDIY